MPAPRLEFDLVGQDRSAEAFRAVSNNLAGIKQQLDAASGASNRYQQANDNLGRSAGALRANLSNVGFQVQDVTQQLAQGVNPLIIWNQQVPQLAGALGPWGVAAGVVAGVLGLVVQNLWQGTDALTKFMDKLSENAKLDTAIEKFKQLNSELQKAAQLQAQADWDKAKVDAAQIPNQVFQEIRGQVAEEMGVGTWSGSEAWAKVNEEAARRSSAASDRIMERIMAGDPIGAVRAANEAGLARNQDLIKEIDRLANEIKTKRAIATGTAGQRMDERPPTSGAALDERAAAAALGIPFPEEKPLGAADEAAQKAADAAAKRAKAAGDAAAKVQKEIDREREAQQKAELDSLIASDQAALDAMAQMRLADYKAWEKRQDEKNKNEAAAAAKASKATEQAYQRTAQSIQNYLGNALEDAFDGSITSAEEAADAIGSIFRRMAAEVVSGLITEPLTKVVTQAGQIFQGGWSGLFATGSQPVDKAATAAQNATGAASAATTGTAGQSGSSGYLQAGVTGALTGAAIGAIAPSVTGGNQTGSMVGGTVGGAAGAVIGSIFGPGGTVIGGIIGSMAGSVLGGLLGGGSGDKVQDNYVSAYGDATNAYMGQSGRLSKNPQGASQTAQMVSQALQLSDQLMQLTGATGTSFRNLSVQYGNSNGFGVSVNGRNELMGGSQQEATAQIVKAIVQGLQGTSGTVGQIIGSGKLQYSNPQQVLEDIGFADVYDSLVRNSASATTYVTSLRQLDSAYADAIRNAERFGLATEELAEAQAAATEKLTRQALKSAEDAARAQGQAIDQLYGQFIDPIVQMRDALDFGPSSILAPIAQLDAAQNRYTELLAAARQGDTDALGRISGAGQSVIDLARSVYASGSDSTGIVQSILKDLSDLQGELETQRDTAMGAMTLELKLSLAQQTERLVQALTDQEAELEAIRREVEKLRLQDA